MRAPEGESRNCQAEIPVEGKADAEEAAEDGDAADEDKDALSVDKNCLAEPTDMHVEFKELNKPDDEGIEYDTFIDGNIFRSDANGRIRTKDVAAERDQLPNKGGDQAIGALIDDDDIAAAIGVVSAAFRIPDVGRSPIRVRPNTGPEGTLMMGDKKAHGAGQDNWEDKVEVEDDTCGLLLL